jgi:Ca2+-binding RTX toxin-like protein
MAIITGNLESTSYGGAAYTILSSDPYAFQTASSVLFASGAYGRGVTMGQSTSSFTAAGTIQAVGLQGTGISIEGSVSDRLLVLGSGYVSGAQYGVYIAQAAQGTIYIENSGTISGGSAGILAFAGAAGATIINHGTISGTSYAMQLGDGADAIINTGLIAGDVRLLAGMNLYDGRGGGVVTGRVLGGSGNDTYYIDHQTVISDTGGGYDTVTASIDYAISFGIENLVLEGSARVGTGNSGANTIEGNAMDNALSGGAGNDELYAYEGNDELVGGVGDDQLNGDEGDDRLLGGADADLLFGGYGEDRLLGGSGDDTLVGGVEADVLDGGAGIDTADYGAVGGSIVVNLLTGTATGDAAEGDSLVSVENLLGGLVNDILTGNAGANELSGSGGNDKLYGGSGDDVLHGSPDDGDNTPTDDDLLDGGAGIDTVSYLGSGWEVTASLATKTSTTFFTGYKDTFVSIENLIGTYYNDTLTGDGIANRLDGGEGADRISGGGGIDRIVGGRGNDTLTGGADADFFIFVAPDTANGFGSDKVTDFASGSDKIDFSGVAFIDEYSDLKFTQVGADLRVSFAGGNIVTLLGHTQAQIAAADFIFHG